MKEFSPVILFTYNRPEHTKKTIDSLSKNLFAKETILFIFSDGIKDSCSQIEKENVFKTRHIINNINGFRDVKIIESKYNKGLAKSIIEGVSKVLKENESVIVVEDDLVTSYQFLNYMNSSLDRYYNSNKIASISGYNPNLTTNDYKYDYYLNPRPSSWGWATWKKHWNAIDWNIESYYRFIRNRNKIFKFNRGGNDLSILLVKQKLGLIDSWAIRFAYYHFINGYFSLYPIKSYVQNYGFDGSGTNCDINSLYSIDNLNDTFSNNYPLDNYISKKLIKKFRKFYKPSLKELLHLYISSSSYEKKFKS